METNVVKIKLWDLDVGYLNWDEKANVAVFEYDTSFLSLGLDIAPITMSINSPRSKKLLPWLGDKDKLYQGLPPMIADSLPDKWGNSLFNAWLRDNNLSTKSISPIDHLSFIGNRAIGALEYVPAKALGDESTFTVDVQGLYEFAKQVLNRREATVLDKGNSIHWQDLIKISSSPGGKRPKAIVAINKATQEVISGQGNIPKGYQHYILKYDDNSVYPFAKLEFIYYQMALDAGVYIMPSELRQYGNITHFLTQRFDRKGNRKIHTQTLAAMAPFVNSYEGIFGVIRRLNLPFEDSRQHYLRMVFNVLTRNVDDHNKNFSFCMDHNGEWRLSPAYDLTFSVDLGAPAYVNRHSLTVNGKNQDIKREDLEIVAVQNDIKDYHTLIDQVVKAVDKFEDYATSLSISKSLIDQIKSEFIKI
ncbi:type II toxin-antitoxin system HipA family toxin [Arachidicoccus terrestris]|uniref:type II toxin-antitoxin system HipA family toxin n=1 Tax=Arachidicoccus terrestris TaxID=2875539 RepID=UPI001CC4982B|nr:type II toxin-antitoxin system HipA family toxin [Arachidicoccus terrestris]UAY54805.1 type II toxin-antitoxin system HipA family toxin [Arachidicoccus terrestris]